MKKSIIVLFNIVLLIILSMNGCSTHNNLIKTDNKNISSNLTPTEEVNPTLNPTPTQQLIPTQQPIPTIIEQEQEQESEYIPSGDIHLLMLGRIRDFMGVLVYEEPKSDKEDYKVLLYKLKDYDESVGPELFDASLYQNTSADYVFPDMRENNEAIGKFKEIYWFDSGSFVQGQDPYFIVAVYEVDGKECFDTRLYKETETGYEIDQENSEILNETYRDAKDYPFMQVEDELSNMKE